VGPRTALYTVVKETHHCVCQELNPSRLARTTALRAYLSNIYNYISKIELQELLRS